MLAVGLRRLAQEFDRRVLTAIQQYEAPCSAVGWCAENGQPNDD